MPSLLPIDATLHLDFESAFHVGTGRAEGLANRTVKRTASGAPYVPASALKGALRETAERLIRRLDQRAVQLEVGPERFLGYRRRGKEVVPERCEAPRPENMCKSTDPCIVCRVFGNALSGRRLIVDDARPMDEAPERSSGANGEEDTGAMTRHRTRHGIETYTQLRIDRRRRGARAGALFTSEQARPTRLRSRLSGRLPLTPLSEGPPAELVLLAATLAATEQIGSGASTGRGQCHVQVAGGTIQAGGEAYEASALVQSIEPLADHLLFA
jgi:CRISPR/Cas system CSM-associated protein Csm3 (group 7 of RAMP superfamily)